MAAPVSAGPPAEPNQLKKTERGFDVWPLPCATPYPRPPANAYDRMLVLTVGKPSSSVLSKIFQVYRGVLCHYSEYFKTMLNSGFQEGESDSLVLNDVDLEIFQMFYDFMNTGDLILDEDTKWDDIINAYIFADYHLAQGFKNKAIDLYFAKIAAKWSHPASRTTSHIYDNTSEESPLRMFQVDSYTTFCLKPKSLNKDVIPKAFLWDLLIAYGEKQLIPCSYPVNYDKEQCVANMMSTFCENYHDHTVAETRPVIHQPEEPIATPKQDAGTPLGSDMVQNGEEGVKEQGVTLK